MYKTSGIPMQVAGDEDSMIFFIRAKRQLMYKPNVPISCHIIMNYIILYVQHKLHSP